MGNSTGAGKETVRGAGSFAPVPFNHVRFAELRKKKYRAQEEFAIKVGSYKNRISLVETGEAVPTIEELDVWCAELGTWKSYLLNESDEPTPPADRFAELRQKNADLKGPEVEQILNAPMHRGFFLERLMPRPDMTTEELDAILAETQLLVKQIQLDMLRENQRAIEKAREKKK